MSEAACLQGDEGYGACADEGKPLGGTAKDVWGSAAKFPFSIFVAESLNTILLRQNDRKGVLLEDNPFQLSDSKVYDQTTNQDKSLSVNNSFRPLRSLHQ